ncbi:proline--tRNA ligase [Fusobacterium perfoetens]|uniref:proline--tRNA ligase n=1 Tax=Fusobacterium perfoetens TaxID=852 RepID=UPI0015A56A42|nr:proline--tRNA ligase [Fusobacterium perfoetens]MCF2612130.1 proline--tRNA ligase [Fusobacterium perfoetens]
MRFSNYYIKTLKETPKEAEVASHKLLLRAGMIKKMASGVYSYLPMGYRTLRKVENIVREEMNRAGAIELFMPVLLPAEIWQESGRWDVMGAEMIRLKDRHERDFVLGPTHEEAITDIVRNDIFSYKSLPVNLYQIQTKFRDERRPRFGLMRGREFLMKDAYSFSVDRAGLDKEFDNMQEAYSKIFTRCGLDFRIVDADSGAIGGSGSREFHVMANSGEDELIFCDHCHYGANVEKATDVITSLPKEELKEAVLVDTPNIAKIEDVVEALNVEIERTVKAIMYKDVVNDAPYMVLIRGDIEVNEVKVKNLINTIDIAMLTDEEIAKLGLFKGFIGPYGMDLKAKGITVIADPSVTEIPNHTAGGNKPDTHYLNVNYGRDYEADIVADVRRVKEGDTCSICGKPLRVARGIECGHIFKLGKKYSEAMHAVVLDENGKEVVMEMGCYGIGISRTMAAAIEQNNDENGIIWPTAIAPFIVDVIATNMKDEAQVKLAEELLEALESNGIETIYDDRNERAGFKFKDADLIGFPFKVVCGKKSSEGIVELKIRRTGETLEVAKENVVETVKELMKKY